MYYILFYKVVDNYVEKRSIYRNEHLTLAQEFQQNGYLVMAGALAEPTDGAVLVFKSETDQIPKDFAINDPYVKNGLVTEWYVRPWNVVIGG